MIFQFLCFSLLASSLYVSSVVCDGNKTKTVNVTVYHAVENPNSEKLVPMGSVIFSEVDGSQIVKIIGNITGLTPGEHGFHIHEKGDLANKCVAAGPHYNPGNKTHGGPKDSERHVGDMGNILADGKGVAEIDITMEHMNLTDLNNRTLVVHEKADDLGRGRDAESKKTGNAGKRVGCGIINVSNGGTTSNILSFASVFAVLVITIVQRYVGGGLRQS